MISDREIQLFLKYLKPYKKRILGITLLAVVCAFFEAINLGALVPLLQLLNSDSDPGGSLWSILKTVFGIFGLELTFVNLISLMGILFVIGQILMYLKKEMQADLWFTFSANLKKKVFFGLLRSDIRHYYTCKSGTFIDLINRQSESASCSAQTFTDIVTYFFFILIYAAMLLYISIPLTAICLVIAGICFLSLNRLIALSKKIGRETVNTNMQMNEYVTERLGLIKLIKIFSSETQEEAKFEKITGDYSSVNTRFWMNGVRIETVFQIIIFILAIVILYLSLLVFDLQLALLLVFIFILIRLTDPLRQLNTKRHEIAGQLASLEKVDAVLNATETHREPQGGSVRFDAIRERIRLEHVSFSYTKEEKTLNDISFDIRKNEMVAIVGASGAGKSTLVDIIIRLFNPDSGRILIDDTDIRDFDLCEFHRKIGFVSQESYIFNDTVLNNICYGSGTARKEKAAEAARTANAHEFIMQLPQGYDTELGERGVLISGGQKQRIALARALYKDPQILILDEATSALDSEAEKIIQQSIHSIKNRYTIIAIAHRLSTIENADRIIVIEKGEIAEIGTHAELIQNDGVYAKYYNIQYGSAHISPDNHPCDS